MPVPRPVIKLKYPPIRVVYRVDYKDHVKRVKTPSKSCDRVIELDNSIVKRDYQNHIIMIIAKLYCIHKFNYKSL